MILLIFLFVQDPCTFSFASNSSIISIPSRTNPIICPNLISSVYEHLHIWGEIAKPLTAQPIEFIAVLDPQIWGLDNGSGLVIWWADWLLPNCASYWSHYVFVNKWQKCQIIEYLYNRARSLGFCIKLAKCMNLLQFQKSQ